MRPSKLSRFLVRIWALIPTHIFKHETDVAESWTYYLAPRGFGLHGVSRRFGLCSSLGTTTSARAARLHKPRASGAAFQVLRPRAG